MKAQELANRVRPHLEDLEQMSRDQWRMVIAQEIGMDKRTTNNAFEIMKGCGVFKEINGKVFSINHDKLNELAGLKPKNMVEV